MPRVRYADKRLRADALNIIGRSNAIIEEYAAQGFTLTLRQLYYQFVARGWIANRQTEYKRLGGIVSDGRMTGRIDWLAIEDRTRSLRDLPHWDSPESILESAAASFAYDKWARQPSRVEVWIEKDALVGVIAGVCEQNDVPYFSCRGYTSQSEVWRAAQRLGRYLQNGQDIQILHMGDHDPSGIDMTRDIEDRISTFLVHDALYASGTIDHNEAQAISRSALDKFQVDRVALNMDQVREFNPPPNPAKFTDSRYRNYVIEHGGESWELDALDPPTLAGLIEDRVLALRDDAIWQEDLDREETEQAHLRDASDNWTEVVTFLEGAPG